jgi:dihydrodipicolinate synthase/N-acetylneuraminate lyase
MFAEGSPSGVKYYLSKLNVIKETFRLPVVSVSNNHKIQIDELMKTMS